MHLLLYDGVCGLCDRVVQFVLAHDRRGDFVFAPLQSATGQRMVRRFGGDADALTTFYVIADFQSDRARMLGKSDAALFVADALGWPWKTITIARLVPSFVLDRVYAIVARRRYRVFGRFDQCQLPQPEHRGRFIDA